MTHLLNTMAIPSQPRIRTMTAMTVTVLRNLKELCDTWPVIAQTSTVTIIDGKHSSYADGVNWYHWKSYHYSARRAEVR